MEARVIGESFNAHAELVPGVVGKRQGIDLDELKLETVVESSPPQAALGRIAFAGLDIHLIVIVRVLVIQGNAGPRIQATDPNHPRIRVVRVARPVRHSRGHIAVRSIVSAADYRIRALSLDPKGLHVPGELRQVRPVPTLDLIP